MSDDIIVTFEQDPITVEVTPEGKDGQSLIPCGTWDSTRVYDYLSIVYYDGASYLALQNVPAGTALTDSDYWTAFAAQNSDPSSRASTWGLIQGNIENQLDLQDELDLKADASDVYTKTETDGLLADKADSADVYTKTESDSLLSAKANSADVYTKTEADNLLGAKANSADVYSKTEADTLLSAKANSADVYTKTEADNLLSAKANTADLGTMSAESASDYYTKTATDSLLSAKADTADLGDLATQDSIDYSSNQITNKPTLGSLADQDTVNYETEVTNKPTLGDLASQDSIDYTSAQLTNKPTLGSIAQYDDAPADSKQYVRKNHDWEDLSGTLAEKADKAMLTESVESSMTATQNYTTGALIIVGDQVLRATSNIANGGTLTIGSNVEEVDLETVIAEKADSADLGTLATKDDVASDGKNYVRKNQAWSELVDPVKTASGDIVTVTDALAEPLAGLTVGIEPVQDLNGYDAPWPAGGGKNLYNSAGLNYYTIHGITITESNGTLTLNNTATANAYFTLGSLGLPQGNYTFSVNNPVANSDVHFSFRDGDGNYYSDSSLNTANKIISITDKDVNSIIMYVTSGTSLSNFVVKPQLETGTTATSWVPYENICPISGHTSATVTRTGKNLINISDLTGIGWASSNATLLSTFNSLKEGEYTFSFVDTITATTKTGAWRYGFSVNSPNGNISQYTDVASDPSIGYSGTITKTFTITSSNKGTFTAAYFYGCGSNGQGKMGEATLSNIQLELGSTATDYSPYTGTTLPISWQSEAGTVYGGTLDVVTGTLKTRPYYASYNGEALVGPWLSDRDAYAEGTTPTTGAQVVDLGGAETSYQLSAQTLALLAGDNVLWADTGDIALTYWTASAELLLKAIDARIASAN